MANGAAMSLQNPKPEARRQLKLTNIPSRGRHKPDHLLGVGRIDIKNKTKAKGKSCVTSLFLRLTILKRKAHLRGAEAAGALYRRPASDLPTCPPCLTHRLPPPPGCVHVTE